MSAVEDLLNSPDYFDCERHRCRMSKSACLGNQFLAQQDTKFDAYSGLDYPSINRKASCLDCVQGQKIKEDHNMIGTCKNCGRPDITIVQGKDGICFSCNRFAANTRGDERIKKLAQAAEKYRDKPVQVGGRKAKEKAQGDKKRTECPVQSGIDREKIKQHLRERIAAKETAPAVAPVAAPVPIADTEECTESPLIPIEKIVDPMKEKVRGLVTQMREKTEQEQAKKGWPSVVIYFEDCDQYLFDHLQAMAKRERRNPDQQLLHMLDCSRRADLELAS